MKRIVYALLATVSGLVLLFSYRTSLEGAGPTDAAAALPLSGGAGSASSTPPSSSTPTAPSATPTPSGSAQKTTTNAGSGSGSTSAKASSSGFTDGTFQGSSVNTEYGPVQVQITVSGGAISDVTMLAYPNGSRRDQQINQNALPTLISETISAQSANVQMVSGATYTSEGYLRSLQSAIDKARA